MASLLRDNDGVPIPQYINNQGQFEAARGSDGSMHVAVTKTERVGVNNQSSTTRYTTSGTAQQILYGEKATRVVIKNVGANEINIGFTDTVTVSTGYPLSAGESIDMDVAGGPIYVTSGLTGTIAVMVI